MNGYLVNFAIYTLAMVGFLALAIFVYKKTAYSTASAQNKDFLKVENTLRLSATKTVYVIKAGNEKFLIAGDTANTTMLAKLENDVKLESDIKVEENTVKNKMTGISIDSKILQKLGRG